MYLIDKYDQIFFLAYLMTIKKMRFQAMILSNFPYLVFRKEKEYQGKFFPEASKKLSQ